MVKRAKQSQSAAKSKASASEPKKKRSGAPKSAEEKEREARKRRARTRKIDKELGCKLGDEIWIDLWRDAAFRAILSKEEAKEALIGLLNAVAKQAGFPLIVDLWHLNPEQLKGKNKGKDTYVDLLVEDETGRRYVVEMQSYHDPDYLNRLTVYGSRAFIDQLEDGAGYGGLKTVYCVAFVREPLFTDDKDCWFAESTHYIKGREGKEELGPVKDFLVRIPQDNETPKGPLEPELVNWQRVIGGYSKMNKEERDALEAVTPGLKNLREVMATFTNARKRAIREKALDEAARAVDQKRRIRLAREEARKEGREEARKEERERVARNLIQTGGITLDQIAEAVGIPVVQVEALANGANLA